MRISRCSPGFIVLLLGISAQPAIGQPSRPDPAKASRLDVEFEDLQPGLIAHYQSLVDKDATLIRIEAKPAFSLGHSTPHPRLPPGPFEVVWTGVLFLTDPAPVTFDAQICGEVMMDVDGVVVLQGRGERETARISGRTPLNRDKGAYRLRIQFRSLPDLPARLQISWQGRTFSHEPLAAWHLKHVAADVTKAVSGEQLIDQGRTAVGRFGCARCHRGAFPGVTEPPPGPSLADAARRINRDWLLDWLENPARVRADARMPKLFAADRTGFVERWIITEYLLGTSSAKRAVPERAGDHRMGRSFFITLGCAACHFLPEQDPAEQPPAFERTPLTDLHNRLPADELAAFLGNPHARYPDGRMPRLPATPDAARDIAAYLLLWSRPAQAPDPALTPPSPQEINAVSRRLRVNGVRDTATALVREKRCAACHSGLDQNIALDVPLLVVDDRRGCLSDKGVPRFTVAAATKQAIAAFQTVAAKEKHLSPFTNRQRTVERLGCLRCHQRDSDRPPPLEAIGSLLGGSGLEYVPFQRTPRLTDPLQKYTRTHLASAIREGVSELRPARYSYRMPAFGSDAEAVIQALAEADGELPAGPEPPAIAPADPTLATLAGPNLVGFQGYSCVSCHLWNGQTLSEPDPGAVGTDLTRVTGRIRRDWFDRFLEGPARAHPGTPMPAVFVKGEPAILTSVLDGDPAKQKEAMWSYFARGKQALSPKPPPPSPVGTPAAGEPPLVAQIPVRLPDRSTVESICLLYSSHDLIVYDVGTLSLNSSFTGARIERGVQGRLRSFVVTGTPFENTYAADPPIRLIGAGKPEVPLERTLIGYDRIADGMRIRWQVRFASGTVVAVETLRLASVGDKRRLHREVRLTGIPAAHTLELRSRISGRRNLSVRTNVGDVKSTTAHGVLATIITPDEKGAVVVTIDYEHPPSGSPPALEKIVRPDPGTIAGSLERPGYRAIAYPRPKTSSGEDRMMPAALAVNPKDGRVFVASMKTGELLVLNDPTDNGKQARFENYTHGLFQEAFSMLAEPDALYVLHRRNLTRIVETKGAGVAARFDRVAALPHGVADTYDYGYGLVRDRRGALVFSYAPYADGRLPGAGGALRLIPGQKPEEIAFGFRNPIGWCSGPEREIFFTDNQGEWVATNKLCHLVEGRFYGFPNPAQPQHTTKPHGKTAVWVPYGWAKSINGVTHDSTGGKFGPFAGQIFMAELMYGGGIIRANVEKVNGEYQGACFPFWGQGLLGPLCLAFDPKGRLWVGGITEPGWMAQPDRGALFRIDFTGTVPFEMQSIHVLPRGFRIVFTEPVSPNTTRDVASYAIEHFRYEYTGAYGSPELDRTRVAVERAALSPDGCSVDLTTPPLVKDRVYMIHVRGVKSAKGESPVHPTGAYTLNEIPPSKP